MQIFLFRHAERENTGTENPPLSSRGHGQAQELAQQLRKKNFPAAQKIFVSPKIRTHQTFIPFADAIGIELTMTPELDERQNSETGSQFTTRVRRFLSFLERQNGVIFVCTHLDWIEEAMIAIPSETDLLSEKYQAWSPAQFLEFDIQEGLWHVLRAGRI